jgi:ComF family protein
LRGIISLGAYHAPLLRLAIHGLKFRGWREIAQPLATALAYRLAARGFTQTTTPSAALCPIPLHSRRERFRGYNQAALLAAQLSKITKLPCIFLLSRPRPTFPQTKLEPDERWENMQGAFAVTRKIFPRQTIILVDDVATTSATLEVAAQTLNRAGAKEIWAATVARGR